MTIVNHQEKCLFVHVLKNGGTYVNNVLTKYYNFISTISYDLSVLSSVKCDIGDKSMYVNNLLLVYKNKRYSEYTKFGFVRNPYTKFISGVNFIQKTTLNNQQINEKQINEQQIKLRQKISEEFINMTISDFISKKDIIPINMYNHIFVKQTECLYFDNVLQVDRCYRFENLQDELTELTKTFVSDYGEVDFINDPTLKKNETNVKDPFYTQYDEAIFNFVNEWFAEDFVKFGYTKFETFQEFLDFYSSNNNNL